MIFITGDIHGSFDIAKLSTRRFPEQKELTRNDYLIICGDFGLLWDNSGEELYWRKWLENKPWTTLWIDGNHENFDLLDQLPEEEWHGGMIHRVSEHIFHLCRGYVFDIDGRKIFAFGGAESHDKEFRKQGVSIWEREMPSDEEYKRAVDSLNKAGNRVDVIITHSLPARIQEELFPPDRYVTNRLTRFFDVIDRMISFKLWFSGHYHRTMDYDARHHLIFNSIVKLTDDGFENIRTERILEDI
ncbi:MAG: metallophosphoesterase [Ruminococcus sp.]|nr:metallophosphoesterase [Ruminococcus sp.]